MSEFQQKRSGCVRVRVEDGRAGGCTEVPFTWEQSLDEVDLYIPSPNGEKVTKKTVPSFRVLHGALQMRVVMGPGIVAVFDAALGGRADGTESFWTTDDDGATLHIVIAKAVKGEPWATVFVDATTTKQQPSTSKDTAHGDVNVSDLESARREMLLQRFQEEHPGFDFSDAQVSGAAPEDPMNFMSNPL